MLLEEKLKDKHLIKKIARRIHVLGLNRKVNLMEVCGTHTYSFFRSGLNDVLSDYVNLISGPGCPVCITENLFVDKAIYLSKNKKNVIATFGDLLKVKGSLSSLYREKSNGANILIVYSPLDALEFALKNKDKRIIFLGVGFETTAPLVAATIKEAGNRKIKNFFVLTGHRLIPPAMEALCQDKNINIEGFICPGHVSAIIGELPYYPIVEKYKIGCVICGFEPVDMVLGIYTALKQIKNARPAVDNEYRRVVKKEGNATAIKIMYEVFQAGDAGWRGLGIITNSGLFLNKNYAEFNAENLIKTVIKEKKAAANCLCAEVVKGKITPRQCPLFTVECSPANPIGPCMISLEGTCRIYYEYRN